MSDNATKRRLPAEWEPQRAVLMAWPHSDTDWAPMLADTVRCFAGIIREISRETPVIVAGPSGLCRGSFDAWGFDPSAVTFVDCPTNDTWARDFGPITVETPGGYVAIDFKFNGWGLKFAADRDNLINSVLDRRGLLPVRRENRLNFVLEGGSIESDGQGTILTTSECLLSPNRNGASSKDEIEAYLKDAFGADRVLWLDHGALAGDDTDSHIDTLARLVAPDTIVYCGPGEEGDPNNERLLAMREEIKALRTAEGLPYHLIELPLPDPIYDADGMQLPATYANFLISNRKVFLPVYGQARKDALATMLLQSVFTDREVVPVDCRALIEQHGSLHCVTMQFPK